MLSNIVGGTKKIAHPCRSTATRGGVPMGLSRIDKIRAKQMAEDLMVKDLGREATLAFVGEYFGATDQALIHLASREGFSHSFVSDCPLRTAGIYYRNIASIDPEFKRFVCNNLIEWFRNMIMEKGKSNIHIRNQQEYRETMEAVHSYFGITPPASIHTFNSILKDEKSLEKIVNDIRYYTRILEIFSFLAASCFKDLDRLIMKRLSSKQKDILAGMEKAEEKRDFNALLAERKRIEAAIRIVDSRGGADCDTEVVFCNKDETNHPFRSS
jgi:hypothetical protein